MGTREQRKDAAKAYVTYEPRAAHKVDKRAAMYPCWTSFPAYRAGISFCGKFPVSMSELLLFKINISRLNVEAGICPTKHPVLNAAINYSLRWLVH